MKRKFKYYWSRFQSNKIRIFAYSHRAAWYDFTKQLGPEINWEIVSWYQMQSIVRVSRGISLKGLNSKSSDYRSFEWIWKGSMKDYYRILKTL